MPDSVNWGFISNGATFESLVHAIIFFEYPTANLFGRPGPDGAQDAISGDGETVFQAKFHRNGKVEDIINDANKEFKKIEGYKKKDHSNFELWKNVKKWVLITNIKINPNDKKKWEQNVVSKFKSIGLDSSITWTGETVESLLYKHPEIQRAYFEGECRVFLSLREAHKLLLDESPNSNSMDIEFLGRHKELQQAESFLNGEFRILPVHGPGGIGKSRFLYEVARGFANQRQILWANVETMSSSSNWFDAIIPERETLVLIDEPREPDLIRRIIEQLRSARSRKWKTIISVRSPKDHVLSVLRNSTSSMLAQELELQPIASTAAGKLAFELLKKGNFAISTDIEMKKLSSQIAKFYDEYPIWITIAVRLLEERKSLSKIPSDQFTLAKEYLEEVILKQVRANSVEPKKLLELIRWVALFKVINTEDQTLSEFLIRKSIEKESVSLQRILIDLSTRRFLINQGLRNRMFQIKPDVMRDYVLQEWLTIPDPNNSGIRKISTEAEQLADLFINGYEGKILPKLSQAIESVALLEFNCIDQGFFVYILNPFIQALRDLAQNGNTRSQKFVANLLPHFSFARTRDAIEIIRAIRKNPKDPQEIDIVGWGKSTISFNHILTDLPWLLFITSKYVLNAHERRDVLNEMRELIFKESEMPPDWQKNHFNDGKRASQLISRIITNDSEFSSSYVQEAEKTAMDAISKLSLNSPLTPGEKTWIKSVVEPQIAIERMAFGEWEDYSLTIRKIIVHPNSKLGKIREKLRKSLQAIIAGELPTESNRILAWNLLSESHSSANRALLHTKDLDVQIVKELNIDLQADLNWVLTCLDPVKFGITEFNAARKLWDWHIRFDSDKKKDLADKCEEVYKHHSSAYLREIFQYENIPQSHSRAVEIGNHLLKQNQDTAIFDFLSEVDEFAKGRNEIGQLSIIAKVLAESIDNSAISGFLKKAFTESDRSIFFQFATKIMEFRLGILRKNESLPTLRSALDKVLSYPTDDEVKRQLLTSLYRFPHPKISGRLTEVDLEFIHSNQRLFAESEFRSLIFAILGNFYFLDWTRFTSLIEENWRGVPLSELGNCFCNLLSSVGYMSMAINDSKPKFSKSQMRWLLDQMLRVPDIDKIRRSKHYLLNLLKLSGTMPLSWLNQAINNRLRYFEKNKNEDVKIQMLSSQLRLSTLVTPIDSIASENPRMRNEVEKLLGFAAHGDLIGYLIPRYLVDVDPEGLVAPGIIAYKIDGIKDFSDLSTLLIWTSFGGDYKDKKSAWGKIAVAGCRAAEKLSEKEKKRVFRSLVRKSSVEIRRGPIGKLDLWYEEQVEKAKDLLAEEDNEELVHFRKWQLKLAELELEEAKQKLSESDE